MNMMKSLLGLENYRIKFSTGEGDYEGTISRIAPEIQLLVITKLIWLPKNLKMGTLTFRAKEIETFSVIGRCETPDVKVPCNYLYERDCQRPAIFDSEFDENSLNESDFCSELESEEKEYFFDIPPFLTNDLPVDHAVLYELDQNFYDAIQHIQKQDVIGLSLESPKIGRYEQVYWLCISTASCTFLFDIKTLKESAFTNGLHNILGNSRIEKIVHDCREVSNRLFHYYDTRLSNVFDTQVADFIINLQRREDCYHVNTLNFCLAQYLNLPREFLFRRKKWSFQDESVFYNLRPIRDDLRNLFTKNVIYLRRLKQELDILLIQPFKKCVDIYMKSIQNKTHRELQLQNLTLNTVPDELLFEGIKIFRFKEHVDIPPVVRAGPPYRQQDSLKEYVNFA